MGEVFPDPSDQIDLSHGRLGRSPQPEQQGLPAFFIVSLLCRRVRGSSISQRFRYEPV